MLKLNCIAEPTPFKDNDLDALQKAVEGPIQLLCRNKTLVVYCNEEGMLKSLNPSAYIPAFLKYLGFTGYMPDMVFGNVAITGDDKKLTKKQSAMMIKQYTVWYDELHADDEDDDDPFV